MEKYSPPSIVEEITRDLTELMRPAVKSIKKSLALAELKSPVQYIASVRREARQTAEFVLGCQGIGPVEMHAVAGNIRLVITDAPQQAPKPVAGVELMRLQWPQSSTTRGGGDDEDDSDK